MKIIDKKSFFPVVCVVYTCLSVGKIVLETAMGVEFGNYQQNLIFMLLLSVLATLVLSQHYRLNRLPLALVILLQYAVLIGAVMLLTWMISFFDEMHPDGYRDMFWSFTIPYVIGAVIYYVSLFLEIKKANRLLQDMKKEGK